MLQMQQNTRLVVLTIEVGSYAVPACMSPKTSSVCLCLLWLCITGCSLTWKGSSVGLLLLAQLQLYRELPSDTLKPACWPLHRHCSGTCRVLSVAVTNTGSNQQALCVVCRCFSGTMCRASCLPTRRGLQPAV